MRFRSIAAFVAAGALAVGVPATTGTAVASTGSGGSSLPTVISWAMSTGQAAYRQPLAAEYLVMMSLFGNPIPIPPDDTHKVVLQRRAAGATRWRAVTTAAKTVMVTAKDGTQKPHYLLVDFAATGNASYRLVYRSPDASIASSVSTVRSLRVSRLMGDRGVNRSGRLLIVGNVNPGWANRAVAFQRRSCATCRWRSYRTVRTGARGQYQVRVYAPRSGSWQYRGSVPATTDFTRSWTHTFTVKAPAS